MKLWSQQTVEERVRTALSAQQKTVEELDPGDTFLTLHNAKKRFMCEHPDADFRSGVVNDEHGTGLRVWCVA